MIDNTIFTKETTSILKNTFDNQKNEKVESDTTTNINFEDIFSQLFDSIKDEYGDGWQEYFEKILLPELQPWEIKELQLFLNEPISLNKQDIDFNISISFKDLFASYTKEYKHSGPLYLKGSSLTYFLIHHLTKACPQSEQCFLERFLRKIYSFKQNKSLWEMLKKEDIEALCQKARPSDLDFCIENEFYDGHETSFVINYLAKKVNKLWGWKKISETLREKGIIQDNKESNLEEEKQEKSAPNTFQGKNKTITVKRPEKPFIKVVHLSEIQKNSYLLVKELALHNFCHVPSYEMHSGFSLISFGDHQKDIFFDLIFTRISKKDPHQIYAKKPKVRNAIFTQGALHLRVDEILFKKELLSETPFVKEGEPFSSSQCFLDELKKDLIPAYEIFEDTDLIIAANKQTKKYTFSNPKTSTELFEGLKNKFKNNLKNLSNHFVFLLNKEIRSHLNYHPIRSLFLLYHFATMLEDKIDEQGLSYICQNVSRRWESQNNKDSWLDALLVLFQKNLPFKLITSCLQMGILWRLCTYGEKPLFTFKKHQQKIAAQIPVNIENDIIYLLVPLDFSKAFEDIKIWEEQANQLPIEAFYLIKFLSGTSFSPYIDEKKHIISFLLSLPIPNLSLEKIMENNPFKEASNSRIISIPSPEKTSKTVRIPPCLPLRLLKKCRKTVHAKVLKKLIKKDKDLIFRKENLEILKELIEPSPSLLVIIKDSFLSLSIEKDIDKLSVCLSLLSNGWQTDLSIEILSQLIKLLSYLSDCQPSQNSIEILKRLQIHACEIFSCAMKKDNLSAFRFLIGCHLCKILPHEDEIDHASILQCIVSEEEFKSEFFIILNLPYNAYWQKNYSKELCAIYKKIISIAPWQEAVCWIQRWVHLDPLALDDEILLLPLNNETLDPSQNSSYDLLKEIFYLTKNRDASDQKPSPLMRWVEKKLEHQVFLEQPQNIFKMIDTFKEIPQIAHLKMISLLIKGYLRHQVTYPHHKDILSLMANFRPCDLNLWDCVIPALLKSQNDVVLKGFFYFIHQNEKVRQVIYDVKHNFWQQIIGNLIKINKEQNFKYLFDSGFDLLNVFELLNSKESLIASICPAYFRYKNLALKTQEIIGRKDFDDLFLLREKCFPILSKVQDKGNNHLSLLQNINYSLIKLALKLGEEEYLNKGLLIALSLIIEKLKLKKDILPLSKKYLQPLILALAQTEQKVIVLDNLPKTPSSFPLPLVLSIINKLLKRENSPELLSLLLLSYLCKEIPPPNVLPENAFMLLAKILSYKKNALIYEGCQHLFEKSIARITVEEIVEKQPKIFELFKAKFINKKILIDKEQNFLLGTAMCEEFNKIFKGDPKDFQNPLSSAVFKSALHIIFIFVLHEYNKELIHQLFNRLLRWYYKIEDKSSSYIQLIYSAGKDNGVFLNNDKSQFFIHAACRNILNETHNNEEDIDFPLAIEFVEEIAEECHPLKCHKILQALENYSSIPVSNKIPIYIKLLEKIQDLSIHEKEHFYVTIANLISAAGQQLIKPKDKNNGTNLNLLKSIIPSFLYKEKKSTVTAEISCHPMGSKKDYTLFAEKFFPTFFSYLQKGFHPVMQKEFSEKGHTLITSYIKIIENIIRDVLCIYNFSDHYDLLHPIFKEYFMIAGDYIEYLARHHIYIEGRLFTIASLLFQQITPEKHLKARNKILKTWISRMVKVECSNTIYYKEIEKITGSLKKNHNIELIQQNQQILNKKLQTSNNQFKLKIENEEETPELEYVSVTYYIIVTLIKAIWKKIFGKRKQTFFSGF